ncbi:54S ribosomal protein L17 mitochondrial [Entomortierella lignicola]|nr:54S ribosomal protein L17 mitochondrial [Entomortierella lignicola]
MSSIIHRQVLRAAARSMSTTARSQIQAIPARLTLAARSYTSASAAVAAESVPLKSNISTSSSALVSSTKELIINSNRIVSGVVVSRQPLILRDLSPFEKEYFLYQQNLERDNAAPFGAEFYFKKGSVAERRWKQQEAERNASSTSTSSSKPSSKSAVENSAGTQDDEVTEEDRVAALEAKVEFNDRVTEADRKNDVRSLERALQRTLYLIVKKPREEYAWQFPQGGVRAAGRELREECGGNMDLWFVGRVPIGHYSYSHPKNLRIEGAAPIKGTKVFFMKAHIFSGQVQVDNKEIVDFAWVTKQEMKDYVSPDYYEAVKDMLSDF